MTAAPFITNAAAQSMMTALEAAIDAGTAAVVRIFDGTPPVDCDAAITGNLLAELTCSATFGTVSDANPGARITAAAISSDTSADSTGTASHFRICTQTGGATAVFQGSVGTAAADLVLNTTAITSGSTVSITSATITLPEG